MVLHDVIHDDTSVPYTIEPGELPWHCTLLKNYYDDPLAPDPVLAFNGPIFAKYKKKKNNKTKIGTIFGEGHLVRMFYCFTTCSPLLGVASV